MATAKKMVKKRHPDDNWEDDPALITKKPSKKTPTKAIGRLLPFDTTVWAEDDEWLRKQYPCLLAECLEIALEESGVHCLQIIESDRSQDRFVFREDATIFDAQVSSVRHLRLTLPPSGPIWDSHKDVLESFSEYRRERIRIQEEMNERNRAIESLAPW